MSRVSNYSIRKEMHFKNPYNYRSNVCLNTINHQVKAGFLLVKKIVINFSFFFVLYSLTDLTIQIRNSRIFKSPTETIIRRETCPGKSEIVKNTKKSPLFNDWPEFLRQHFYQHRKQHTEVSERYNNWN